MARYAVEHIWERKQEYFLIRDHQSWQMVLLPSKYLTHLIRANRSPNTVGRRAKSIRFYLEYLDEKEMELSQVAELEFQEQYEHYVGFLHWLKAGNHLHEKKEKLPSNKTCNAYLKDVFRFFCFLELEADMERLKVLYYDSFTTHDSIGVKRKLRFRSFNGYLKEEERNVRPAEHQEILELLKQCTNCRDQLLIMLLAETGYRIGEILTELHLDDWTIAKLLGHTSVKNVKFYRKMSLQIIADETREIRAEMSRMIRANLAGWGKEYEQI